MARDYSGNPTHETFETTHAYVHINISFAGGDFFDAQLALDFPLSVLADDAMRVELEDCESDAEVLSCLQRYSALGDAAVVRDDAPLLSPEENATADRLLRAALGDMKESDVGDTDTKA